MPRFAAHLTMMYQEYSFLDRFAAAAKDGFTAVDYMFPYDYPADTLVDLLKDHGLSQVAFNCPPGDWKAGERGIACFPDRVSEFQDSFHRALDYAQKLDCPRVHVMAGIAPAGSERARLRETFIANLAWAAELAEVAGKDVLIEPINLRSIPGFFLSRQDEAHAIAAETGKANLKILMDLFHCQIAEGDLAFRLRKYLNDPKQSRVGHIHIAGVPERHEPDAGEVNYDYLFEVIDEMGFDGWIGCEYMPQAGTSDGLGWLRKRLSAAR